MLHELDFVFTSDGVPLAGKFFRNAASIASRQRAVVVTGSWLNVKEQMATGYARALAERGFTTFTFDFAGWGESGGALRHWEMPAQKARDISAAVDFVSSMSFVAPRVGYLAICASAQYALRAAVSTSRIASLALVAGWFHDAASVAPFYGAVASCAWCRRTPRVTSGRVCRSTWITTPVLLAVRCVNGETKWLKRALLHWLNFDGLSPASSLTTPTLLVHSDGCALPENAKAVHTRLVGRKQLAWIDKGTQTDFYDVPEYVSIAADRAAAWFEETL